MTKMMTEFMDDVELSDEESEENEDDEKMKPARKSAKRKKMELIGQLENALHKSVKIIEVSVILRGCRRLCYTQLIVCSLISRC